MAAVTSTASLCPAAGLPSSSSSPFRRSKPSGGHHGRLLTAAACHCRPARMEGVDRREALLGILLAAVAAPALAPADAPAAEATEPQEGGFTTYEDEGNKFSIAVPQGWLIGAGETSGIKSVTAFYPEQAGAADSNASPSPGSGRTSPASGPGERPRQELAEAVGARREAHRFQGGERSVLRGVHAAEPRRAAAAHPLGHRDGVQRLVQPPLHGDRPVHRRRGVREVQASDRAGSSIFQVDMRLSKGGFPPCTIRRWTVCREEIGEGG